MTGADAHLLVAMGDVHGGSTVAVCPPEGIDMDDAGRYLPAPAQVEVWNHYVGALHDAKAIGLRYHVRSTTLAINGDVVDGFHHPKSNAQYISPLESIHVRIAHHVIERACSDLAPQRIHMTRGTGSHVGKAGTLEEGLARVLREEGQPMVEDPDTGQVTSQWRKYVVGGLLVDQRHHGRTGHRNHTRNSLLGYYAQDIEFEHRDDGDRPPDIALRSHYHTYGDSGRPYRRATRVVALPCLQLATEFTHRLAAERLADIGIVAIVIQDGHDLVFPLLAKPKRPTIIEEEAA